MLSLLVLLLPPVGGGDDDADAGFGAEVASRVGRTESLYAARMSFTVTFRGSVMSFFSFVMYSQSSTNSALSGSGTVSVTSGF